MRKRFRDTKGRLTASPGDIARVTSQEAADYYHSGALYLYQGREYTYDPDQACFHSFDGYRLFVAPETLGTFLPDVASEGSEIAFLESC